MLGVLVLYKIMEYTIINKCFKQPVVALGQEVSAAIEKYGFSDIIAEFIADRKIKDKTYQNLEIKVEDNFIIAPQALLRDGNFSSEALKKKFFYLSLRNIMNPILKLFL